MRFRICFKTFDIYPNKKDNKLLDLADKKPTGLYYTIPLFFLGYVPTSSPSRLAPTKNPILKT